MEFPLFHLDWMGDRLLIAIIAILHVLINHAFAVGLLPVVTIMAYRGYKARKENLPEAEKWDKVAKKILFVAFIITTSAGALTGVGIWLSASLVSPASIGSLIRVFFFAWFTEWVVFVIEVILIMYFYLTWDSHNANLRKKLRHIRVGAALSVFSWITMAIIVGILSFMMDSGAWLEGRTFWEGFLNPIYIPQLFFRTPLAFVMGGAIAMFGTALILKKDDEARPKIFRMISFWMLIWTPHVIAAGIFYYFKVPELMVGNIPVAVTTQAFQNWHQTILYLLGGTIFLSMWVAIWAVALPKRTSAAFLIVPILVTMITLGWFERIREFIRKPYVIEQYMYSNQIRLEDYPLYKKDGVLAHSAYYGLKQITEQNKLEAGEKVFMLTCSRCHTTNGINSVVTRLEELFMSANHPLNFEKVRDYIGVMDKGRYYMPPFPGNEEEKVALTEYIIHKQNDLTPLEGAQSVGIKKNFLTD